MQGSSIDSRRGRALNAAQVPRGRAPRAGATVNEPRISNGWGPAPIVRWNEYVLPAASGFAVLCLARGGSAGPSGEAGAGAEGSGW